MSLSRDQSVASSGRNVGLILEILSTAAVVSICAMIAWMIFGPSKPSRSTTRPTKAKTSQNASVLPKEPVTINWAAAEGAKTARVAVLEYSDFQCPYCRRFARDTLPMIRDRYIRSGKLVLAFQHFPLERIHPLALSSAAAADCAGRQGKFWAMHDLLFGDPERLDRVAIAEYVSVIGLDQGHFLSCTQNVTESLRKTALVAQALAISGTPTFLIGPLQPDGLVKVTLRLSGSISFDQFKAAVDPLLAQENTMTIR